MQATSFTSGIPVPSGIEISYSQADGPDWAFGMADMDQYLEEDSEMMEMCDELSHWLKVNAKQVQIAKMKRQMRKTTGL